MVRRYRGPGSVIRDTLAAWHIHEHAGCGCNEICAAMDSDGPDLVEKKLEVYVQRMNDSITQWRLKNYFPIPKPPLFTIRTLIIYGINVSRQEFADYQESRLS